MSFKYEDDRLGILVEEAEHVQSREHFSWGLDGTNKRHIRMAAILGDWVKASSYDKTHPNWVCTPLTVDGDTALHIAVCMEHTNFVKKLVERMRMQDMEMRNDADGNTAFCMAAISGNVEIATILFYKNPGLVWIRGHKEMLPIQLASSTGQPHMVKFLLERTLAGMHINVPFQDIVRLFFLTVTANIHTVASNLLDEYPELASVENQEGLTALQVLARLPFREDDLGYGHILSSLFKRMEEEVFPNSLSTTKAMFDAAKSGNTMILKLILNHNPSLLMKVNSNGQSLLHSAILYRQSNVYRLILGMGAYKNVILQLVDHDGNNVLHSAGKLAAEARFGSPRYPVLTSNEELWFKDVEKIVPPAFKTMENRDCLTPDELFYKEHKESYEKALSEVNGIATNFLVVATLIVTIGATGWLTITDKTTDGKTAAFQPKTWYIIFVLSIGVGVSLCILSMIFFTSVICPTIWTPKRGYINSRLTRLSFGCLLVGASIVIMGSISVISGYVLICNYYTKWAFCVIAALIAIPGCLSSVIHANSLRLVLHIILCIFPETAVRMLSRIGIKWDPVSFGENVM